LQFYDLTKEDGKNNDSPVQALKLAQEKKEKNQILDHLYCQRALIFDLVVKTVKKGDCNVQARRGDTLVINFEGRVASPGGPVFAEATDAELVLGKNQASATWSGYRTCWNVSRRSKNAGHSECFRFWTTRIAF
jgi:hypothetical protein